MKFLRFVCCSWCNITYQHVNGTFFMSCNKLSYRNKLKNIANYLERVKVFEFILLPKVTSSNKYLMYIY